MFAAALNRRGTQRRSLMADYDIPTLKDEIDRDTVEQVLALDVDKYKYGFETDIESDVLPVGLNEDTVRFISAKKQEPEWMLEWRLDAFRRWQTLEEPHWAKLHYPKIDFQAISYYSAPKNFSGPKSLDEVDPELLKTYAKLGIPLKEQAILAGVQGAGEPTGTPFGSNVAVDAVFDSVSVVTTFRAELAKVGIIFCSISEAVREYPELVKQYFSTKGSGFGQLLCDAEFGRLHRWVLRLHPQGRSLPHGAVDLFPHQREEDRPVRA